MQKIIIFLLGILGSVLVLFESPANAQCKPGDYLIGEDQYYYYCSSSLNWVDTWYGKKWDENEKKLVSKTLRGLKDGKLRNWIAANAKFGRYKYDGVSPLSVSGSVLRFKDDFFSGVITDAKRENLVAFEAGKVFWNIMKDKPVEGDKTLERWFVDYVSRHSSVIWEMKRAKHKNEDFSGIGDIDTTSQFAYIFRAQALKLDRPKEPNTQQKWNTVIREFQTRIDQLLQVKQ
ncbi:MAG: hypothetical protein QMC83_10005 [Thermodesulfovibrionales bacterium]|nr:hypothetical protein [Thermodesulfovibrionales bacterium]